MQRIKKGDKVRVISGKYATKEGNVLLVDTKHGRAIVEGLNKVKRHKKPSANQEKGGITEKENFLPLCKLALIAPKSPQGISKIKYVINKDGKKVRIAKKTSQEIAGK
jgi:large subunit ribosomal protein L24